MESSEENIHLDIGALRVETSRQFIFGYHFPISHDLYVLKCTDMRVKTSVLVMNF